MINEKEALHPNLQKIVEILQQTTSSSILARKSIIEHLSNKLKNKGGFEEVAQELLSKQDLLEVLAESSLKVGMPVAKDEFDAEKDYLTCELIDVMFDKIFGIRENEISWLAGQMLSTEEGENVDVLMSQWLECTSKNRDYEKSEDEGDSSSTFTICFGDPKVTLTATIKHSDVCEFVNKHCLVQLDGTFALDY